MSLTPEVAPRRIWDRFGGKFFFFSLVIHLVFFLVAGAWVVTEIVTRENRTFEAQALTETGAQQEVQHRVQLARRSGGGAGGEAMSVQRIAADTASTFTLPPMADLQNVGMGAPGGGTGFGAAGLGFGSGTGFGFGSGSGGTAGTVRDIMSIFGSARVVSQASRTVFIVAVDDDMLTPVKGGFDAFEIVRSQISSLVGRLPPSATFNVILFDHSNINLFRPELVPGSVANKRALFDWIRSVNRNPQERGARTTNWRPGNPQLMEDEILRNHMARALVAAAEQKPENIFMIVGNWPWFGRSTFPTPREQAEADRANREIEREDTPQVRAAREAALAKYREDLARVNRDLQARGRSPIIITNVAEQHNRPEVLRAFRDAGVEPVRLEGRGWQRQDGSLIWAFRRGPGGYEVRDVIEAISRGFDAVDRARRPRVNVSLFVGPEDKQPNNQESYRQLVRRFGAGNFVVLDFSELRRIQAQSGD
jgi:hypothetical protein